MSEPEIANKMPAVLELEPGTYHYCACGRSKGQPYCDGSHAGTEFTPMQFVIEEKKRVALCQCKRTGNAPFCDGSHSKL
ncbi:MAG: CDGSH-type Zn-finger protein [Planctomycetota bacterium]|jgi:CDGSH-type Zn-finger protein